MHSIIVADHLEKSQWSEKAQEVSKVG